ncbi:MAG: 50S ribosomal protein L9 [Planctomycetota bacterium]|nr:50S ribosomal protein L9 [Planctomycetota bacterium]
MPKTYRLLLTENVESLGIVGDVVTVRAGYARNYLLPRNVATEPSEEKINALASRRAEAERHVAEMRSAREQMVEKLEGYEITLERSCNDQGLLYGSVTQQDVATALLGAGFTVRPRDVRLSQTIKRVGNYDLTIKPDVDLEANVKLHVNPDRPLESFRREEPEPAAVAAAEGPEGEAAEAGAGEKPQRGKKKQDASDAGDAKPARGKKKSE